jgi:hypothetical protein
MDYSIVDWREVGVPPDARVGAQISRGTPKTAAIRKVVGKRAQEVRRVSK